MSISMELSERIVQNFCSRWKKVPDELEAIAEKCFGWFPFRLQIYLRMSSTATNNSTNPAATTATAAATAEVLPSVAVLQHAARLAIQQDKPILLDYYVDTATGKAFMGEDEQTKERMLVKSSDEFTSLIQKVYKVQEDFIIMTENSIYIVSGKIQKRRINATQMRQVDYETL